SGLGPDLIQKSSERLDGGSLVLRQRGGERFESTLRITPTGAELGVEPARSRRALAAEQAKQLRPRSLRRGTERCDSAGTVPRHASDRGEPLLQRDRPVLLLDGSLGEFRGERIRLTQP